MVNNGDKVNITSRICQNYDKATSSLLLNFLNPQKWFHDYFKTKLCFSETQAASASAQILYLFFIRTACNIFYSISYSTLQHCILYANQHLTVKYGSLYLPPPLLRLIETFWELPLWIYCPSPLKIEVDAYRVNEIFPPKINGK